MASEQAVQSPRGSWLMGGAGAGSTGAGLPSSSSWNSKGLDPAGSTARLAAPGYDPGSVATGPAFDDLIPPPQGEALNFDDLIPAPQTDAGQYGSVNFDDLIPDQGAPWRPLSLEAGGVSSGQAVDDAVARQAMQSASPSRDALINSPLWQAGMAQYVAANAGGPLVDPQLMADLQAGSDLADALAAFGGAGPQDGGSYGGGDKTDLAAALQAFSIPGVSVVAGGPQAPQAIKTTTAGAPTNRVLDAIASGDPLGDLFASNFSAGLNNAMAAALASAAKADPFSPALSNAGAPGVGSPIRSYDPIIDTFGIPGARPQGSFTLPSVLEPTGMWGLDVRPALLAQGEIGGNGGPPWAGPGPIPSPGIPGPNNGAPVGFEPFPGQPGQDGPQVVEGVPGYNHGGLWYPDQPKLSDGTPWPAINSADPKTLSFFLSTLSTDKTPYARKITIYVPVSGRFSLPLLWAETPTASYGPPPAGYLPIRLIGAPQNTWLRDGTATGHALDGLRHALDRAQSGEYDEMYFNMTLRVATNGMVNSGMRPDVLMRIRPLLDLRHPYGAPLPPPRYDIYESLSPSQDLEERQFELPNSDHIREINGVHYQ